VLYHCLKIGVICAAIWWEKLTVISPFLGILGEKFSSLQIGILFKSLLIEMKLIKRVSEFL
jgi:hypothetical protein